MSQDYSAVNESKTGADECDDPDFDVMAELESLCYDDLFDELRSDRAVRISKMEAKVSFFLKFIKLITVFSNANAYFLMSGLLKMSFYFITPLRLCLANNGVSLPKYQCL